MTAADMRTTDRTGAAAVERERVRLDARSRQDPPSKKWVPDIIMMGHF